MLWYSMGVTHLPRPEDWPGDPLNDITLLERVGFVIKGGMVYRDELMKR